MWFTVNIVWNPTCCLTRAKSASSFDGSGSGYWQLQRDKKVSQWCSWQTSTCPHIVMTAKNHQFFDHTLIKIHQHQDDQPAKLGEVERSVRGNVSVDPCRGLLVCTWVKIDHSICLHLRHFSSCSYKNRYWTHQAFAKASSNSAMLEANSWT